ncbi:MULTISPECIES: 5-methyltetrahydropteroyltriglutamate--homocysteine S-methyltransferase [unclassified Crossiella]|uniref:5-methyltetrahydropteroyltriglutamate-- homocysteine S-methyltransferase n=1 Tax=unclassified Crossiella TaxID=2620835 RepID=UPI001FFF4857|nr:MULTISPECIES: 5-methyltetrahydropteroyltriglutamate--homocysteine S-methyltransferase [unclassified Crossiella]MCK2244557.1 5-methyltetrahydropteroyltriglutamate--homocysteine S-methyltransferase [Crossiella sp. S99.2]MCK2258188.1 5-methyltetrahydropteroyltriglutamate--homocysteine S-methyltransferase [Crossiella sp. S99.1]
MTSGIGATVLGYPRIGPRRELKRAVEQYWAGRIGRDALLATAKELRTSTWLELHDAGLDSVPSNTFSFYDQVLDTAALVGAVPARFRQDHDLDTYFAAARGTDEVPPLEMTKWFDTNYHYLVPEIDQDTVFFLAGGKPIEEYREAKALGVDTRPVLLGPVTFLLLAKGADPLARLDDLLAVYVELLGALAAEGVAWVQFDEPAFAADRTEEELAALGRAYDRLAAVPNRPKLLVTGFYGSLGPALPVLAGTAVEAIAVDLVAGSTEGIASVPALQGKTLVAGVIDGRNVWRADLRQALAKAVSLAGAAKEVVVGTSSTLLHVPYDLDAETGLEPAVRSRLAFARQKVREVVLLGRALREGATGEWAEQAVQATAEPRRDDAVRAKVAALQPADRLRAPYAERAAAQDALLGLPPLATTTIGSFPQTGEIRTARAGLRTGDLTQAQYDERMRAEIARVIKLQEDIGLDVLVHGEPERNDMVQYFAEHLDGFATTELGWVQSYGSRCVRPPIIHGDVTRPKPITVDWATYAQSLTGKPVKGMLTGPVTILAWSFVRDDQPLGRTADQVALALREEIADLEAAGIRIIQVDEPALRELLPLHAADQPEYLEWSVGSFQLAVAGAAVGTQIHTHLCYSEFSEVIDAIDGLGADVTTIEAARSKMEVLEDLRATGFSRGVGPGVYDIHSPRVPGQDEVTDLVAAAAAAVPPKRLWINPDCGLKTRGYAEVEPALRHLVTAARKVRETLA